MTRFMPALCAPLCLILVARPATARELFVSPAGVAGADGSKERPLDLATALSEKSPARPGDTVWLLGGVYAGAFTSHLTGTTDAPILVRQAPGGPAVLDGKGFPASTLTVRGAHAWYWGFEVMNSDPTRVYRTKVNVDDPASPDRVRGVGVNVFGPHTKCINLVIHDTLGGFGLWQAARDTEVYGCLTYNNGVIDPARGHGHGLYIQNREGTKFIREVISFNNHATGMKGYTEEGYVQGLHFEGVCSFNNGWLTLDGHPSEKMSNLFVGTTDHPADRITVVDNYLYHAPRVLATNLQLGYQNPANGSLTVKGNHVIGGSIGMGVKNWTSAIVTDKTPSALRRRTTQPPTRASSRPPSRPGRRPTHTPGMRTSTSTRRPSAFPSSSRAAPTSTAARTSHSRIGERRPASTAGAATPSTRLRGPISSCAPIATSPAGRTSSSTTGIRSRRWRSTCRPAG